MGDFNINILHKFRISFNYFSNLLSMKGYCMLRDKSTTFFLQSFLIDNISISVNISTDNCSSEIIRTDFSDYYYIFVI